MADIRPIPVLGVAADRSPEMVETTSFLEENYQRA
jgi:hypothetical protein